MTTKQNVAFNKNNVYYIEIKEKTLIEINSEMEFNDQTKIIEPTIDEVNSFISNIVIDYIKTDKITLRREEVLR